MSLFDVIKNNAAMNRQLELAKKAALPEGTGGQREKYEGPDGEFECTLFTRSGEKDGVPYAVFTYVVAGGEHANKELGIRFFKLCDTDNQTALQTLEKMMCDIQKLGIPTAGVPTADIESALQEVQKTRKVRVARVTSGKYVNVYLNGLVPEAVSGVSGTIPSESGPMDELDNGGPQEASESLTEGADGDGDVKPSDWVGFDVKYKTSPRATLKTYTVCGADDAAMTVDLKDAEGKTLEGIRFTSLDFGD